MPPRSVGGAAGALQTREILGKFCLLYQSVVRDAILTCAREPTRVSLIYRTETTNKKCRTEKLKSTNGYVQK